MAGIISFCEWKIFALPNRLSLPSVITRPLTCMHWNAEGQDVVLEVTVTKSVVVLGLTASCVGLMEKCPTETA